MKSAGLIKDESVKWGDSGQAIRVGRLLIFAIILLPVIEQVAVSQEIRVRLEEVVVATRRNYPALAVVRAEEKAAAAGVKAERTSLLPRMEVDWQQTRGTRNNIFGPFLPQLSVNPISGPQLNDPSIRESVWGSGGGVAVTWEFFDFGVRRAGIGLAERRHDEARARSTETQFEVEVMAIDRFLSAAAAEQTVRSAVAAVERLASFTREVDALVSSELRPGADSSRAAVELAIARNTLIEARRTEALAKVALAEVMGQAGRVFEIDADQLTVQPPPEFLPVDSAAVDQTKPDGGFSGHPLLRRQQSAIEIIQARRKVLNLSIYPRLSWQTNLFGRGSGARVDGRRLENRGFYPDTANWLTGLTLTFTPSEIFRNRALQRVEEQNLAAARARFEETQQLLKSEDSRARVLTESARAFAENAPRQLEAAQLTELRIRKRYEAELGTVAEVAEAQRLLAQAEVGLALARLALWRARLAECQARGDLTPFLKLLGTGGTN
ncbi:MAG: TolC family protein [Acidobacteria bacterium]|nr:TolC family protein [Acidobacteriota bacterium]